MSGRGKELKCWPQDPIKTLGIFFSYDLNKANEWNFVEKNQKFRKDTKLLEKRNLTLYGKINIVKTFGLSKLIYNSSVLVVPENLIKEIEKLIFSFIWDGKPAKIKKSTIIGERKHGGLKMTDFNTMIKAHQLHRHPHLNPSLQTSSTSEAATTWS